MTCSICEDTGVLACHGDGHDRLIPADPLRPYVPWSVIEGRVNSVFGDLAEFAQDNPQVRTEWQRNRELWLQTVEHKIIPGGCPFCAKGIRVTRDLTRQHALTRGYQKGIDVSKNVHAKPLAGWAYDQHAGLKFSMPEPNVCREAATAAMQAARIEPVWGPYATAWSKVIASYQDSSHRVKNAEKPM